MNVFQAILNLFYPDSCLTCNKPLLKNEVTICTICRDKFPKTHFIDFAENQAEKIFYGKLKIEQAAAYYWYSKRNIVQELIFQLKYRNHQEIGELLGTWIAFDIKKSARFKNIDVIIPIPLHPKKLQKRGYNQLTFFGKTLGVELSCNFEEKLLIKTKNTITQTKAGRLKRWQNTKDIFALADCDKKQYEGKHFLLIDDVLTTGATLESCAQELIKIPNIKISILTIAIGA